MKFALTPGWMMLSAVSTIFWATLLDNSGAEMFIGWTFTNTLLGLYRGYFYRND